VFIKFRWEDSILFSSVEVILKYFKNIDKNIDKNKLENVRESVINFF